jgi:REP element-mobilizing transposase RayT
MSTYAVTTVTFQRRAIFLRTANAEMLVSTIFEYRNQGRFLLHAFAVMPEHLHVVLTPATGQTVERCAQCIKGGFSFRVRKQFRGEVWQLVFTSIGSEMRKTFKIKSTTWLTTRTGEGYWTTHLFTRSSVTGWTECLTSLPVEESAYLRG